MATLLTSTTHIYVLELQHNKYYIGKSQNPLERYEQHKTGDGSSWTRKYTPISILEIILDVSPFEEDRITKEYMAKYGIDQVRGGTYVSEILDPSIHETLQREIWGAQDKCLVCGKMGHFANECYSLANRRTLSNTYVVTQPKSLMPSLMPSKTSISSINTCFRCGHIGHYKKDCYARKHISGKFL